MTRGARLLGRHKRAWLALTATLLAALAAAFTPPPQVIVASRAA